MGARRETLKGSKGGNPSRSYRFVSSSPHLVHAENHERGEKGKRAAATNATVTAV